MNLKQIMGGGLDKATYLKYEQDIVQGEVTLQRHVGVKFKKANFITAC